MIKILNESFQDVVNYLTSSNLKEELIVEFPQLRDSPENVEVDVLEYIVNAVQERFPDEIPPIIVTTFVLKVSGAETEILASDHLVIQFNWTLYDYTAHQFADSYQDLLSFNNIPVVQKVITNERQINEGVSSVKSYALLK